VHNHLDWHDPADWLEAGQGYIYVAWLNGEVAGLMGVSDPLNATAWLRLIALASPAPAREILPLLWNAVRSDLMKLAVRAVYVLIIDDWLREYVRFLGFSYDEEIITLRRSGTRLPEPNNQPAVVIRPAEHEDILIQTTIDQSSFVAPWQMAEMDLRYARKIAAVHTVALLDNEIVGYQLSTQYRQSGHLARLAVAPDMQGLGIGAALLDDMIRRFLRRRVRTVTVNTQESNVRSQRLYIHHGFRRNGYDLPVYTINLTH
jgi:ribosomal-protein-alanine N-acetyltransferase